MAHKSGMSLNYVNALVYEAITNMLFEETFGDFMDEILSADDNDGNVFNGTPHDIQICDAFVNDHGIIGSFLKGNLSILNDIVVGNGATLTISSGSVLIFNNGSSITFNNYATLNASGTSAAPILFDFVSPNLSTYNGIVFNSTSMATINYCQIRNAYRGIYENGWSINITNSAISNCYYGIYLYNCSPTIQYCNIHDNVNSGIYLVSSSPYLYNNYLTNNYYGVYCITNSNAHFGYNNAQGKNGITNNYCGIYCYNNSHPILGQSSPANGGNNNFVNASHNVENYSSGTVYAQKIWWGTTNPALFGIVGSGTTSYSDHLTSSVNISPAPPLSKTGESIYASMEREIPMLSEMDKAYELVASGNLTEARQICMNLVNNYPDYSVSYNALNLLKETYQENDFTSKKNTYKSIFNVKSKKDLHAIAGLILSDIDKENKLKYIDEVIEKYKGENVIELALFDKFVYYYFELDDVKNARSISNELDKQFPESMGAIEAHKILGDEEYFKSDIFINKNRTQESNQENEIPNSFSLDGNYPNPFNPTTEIKFSVPVTSNVKLTIYNIMGQEIKSFESDGVSVGTHSFNWNGTNKNDEQVSSGIYIYRLRAIGNNGQVFERSAKMILLR